MLLSDVQPLKALLPIVVKPLPSFIVLRDVQPLNSSLPIVSSESGRTTFVRLVLSAKVRLGIRQSDQKTALEQRHFH